MRIELAYAAGRVRIGAVDETIGTVAIAEADTLEVAVKSLIERFSAMQHETIDALRACGIIRNKKTETPPEEMS